MDVRAGVGPEHIAEQTVRWDRAGTFNVADGLHRGHVRREAAVDATGREKEEREARTRFYLIQWRREEGS